MQFDTGQLVSSAEDNTILIWDFGTKLNEDIDLKPPWAVGDSEDLGKNKSTDLGTTS